MGAVFTIALFSPLIILNFVLDKFGIDLMGIFGQIMESIKIWLEANPETAMEIGNALKDVFKFIIEFAEKFN